MSPQLRKITSMQHIQPDGIYMKLQKWLQENPGGPNMRDDYIRDKVIAILGGTIPGTSIKVRTSDGGARPGAWHPSSLKRCMRSQVFEFMGVPFRTAGVDPQLALIFHDGLFRHIRLQMTGMNSDIFTDFEVPGYNKQLRIAWNLDAIDERIAVGFEIKGTQMLHVVKKYNKHLPEHDEQIQAYLLANPDLDHMTAIYEDKRFQELYSVAVYRDDDVQESLRETVDTLNDYIEYKQLPPILEGCRNGKGKVFKECQYCHICRTTQSWGEADQLVVSTPVTLKGRKVSKRSSAA